MNNYKFGYIIQLQNTVDICVINAICTCIEVLRPSGFVFYKSAYWMVIYEDPFTYDVVQLLDRYGFQCMTRGCLHENNKLEVDGSEKIKNAISVDEAYVRAQLG